MKFLPILMLAALTGCESNPYKGLTLSDKPAPAVRSVSSLGISAEEVMTFSEGTEGVYTIKVNVPAGTPVVSWENLPAGASYDATEGKLKWTPGFDAANDPSDPTVTSREYLATLNLQSSVDAVSVRTQKILLKVKNTPRNLGVTGLQPSYNVLEGTVSTLATFATDSLDFPAATLRLSLKNSSPGLSLMREAGGRWSLKAAFGLDTIQVGRNCTYANSCILRLVEAVVIAAPDGRQVEIPVTVAVRDARQNVVLPVARALMINNELRMAFTLSDPNMEIAPGVEVHTPPSVGTFALTQVRDAVKANAPAFESYFELSWTDIPAEAVGQTYRAVVTTCNSSSNYGGLNYLNCNNHELQLTVQAREVPVPTIARGDWTATAVKYLPLDQPFSASFTVRAGGGARMLSATAVSSDTQDKVELDRTGILKLTGKRPGLKLLTISATNSVGGRGSETFLYEVLPANWSNRVIVGTSAGLTEFAGVEALFGGANREFRAGQSLDARALAFRDTLWAGTQSLQLPDGALDVAFFAANVRTVVISTPMLDKLPAGIVAELRSLGVRVGTRTSAIPNFNIADFELIASRRMGATAGITKLAGTTSSESAHPGLANLTVQASNCEPLLSLFKDGPTPEEYSVGVSCKRANGGRLVVLGFEWSDLRFAEGDADFNAKWFQRMRE